MADKNGKKTGGRKKGVPNKRTAEIRQILENLDFCPVRSLVLIQEMALKNFKVASEEQAPTYLGIAAKASADLLPYLYPRRKAIDLTSEGEGIGQTLVEIVKHVSETRAK